MGHIQQIEVRSRAIGNAPEGEFAVMMGLQEEHFFFENEGKRLYGVLHRPNQQTTKNVCSVICSPIGDERTVVQRLMVEWARELAKEGISTLRFDYRGTGDSEGEFQDYGPDDYLKDIHRATREAETLTGSPCRILCGLRFGATLAATAAHRYLHDASLVLWEPLVSGETYLDEMLRPVLFKNRQMSRAELMQRLGNGGSIAIRGDVLTSSFIGSICGINLIRQPWSPRQKVLLAQINPYARDLRPPLENLKKACESQGCKLTTRIVATKTPWSLKNDYAPRPADLFRPTLEWMRQSCAIDDAPTAPVIDRLKVITPPAPLPQPKEEPVSFLIDGYTVHGILHTPRKIDRHRPAIVMLPQGNVCRTATVRLYVRLARQLVQKGWPVLRFDPRGIGDSEGQLPFSSIHEIYLAIQKGHLVPDALAASQYLCGHIGCESVILAGHCGGAATAVHAANRSPLVAGILLMELPMHLDAATLAANPQPAAAPSPTPIAFYGRKLLSPNAWRRLLTARSNYRSIIRSSISIIQRKAASADDDFAQSLSAVLGPGANTRMLNLLRATIAGGKPVCLAFADGKEGEDFQKAENIILKNVTPPDSYTFRAIPGADHLFTDDRHCHRLTGQIDNWLSIFG